MPTPSELAQSPSIEKLEAALAVLPQLELRVEHRFYPGLYVRTLYIPAGTLATSKIHLSEHPFVVLSGMIAVYSERTGPVVVQGPHFGETKPGDRRVGLAITDTVWVSFHATEKTDPDEIEREIILPHTPGLPPSEDRA